LKFRTYNIDYDTDDQKINGLPKSLTLEYEYKDLNDVMENGGDEISDRTGWCVNGFEVEAIYDEDDEGCRSTENFSVTSKTGTTRIVAINDQKPKVKKAKKK